MNEILIKQNLGSGCWVELITVAVDVEENSTKEDVLKVVINLAEELANSETMHIVNKEGYTYDSCEVRH